MDAKSRVRVGAMLLDRLMPDWHTKIDCDRLHMGSVWWCILGQIYKSNASDISGYDRSWNRLANYYHTKRGVYGSEEARDFMIRNGFCATQNEFSNSLTHHWIQEVMNRRGR